MWIYLFIHVVLCLLHILFLRTFGRVMTGVLSFINSEAGKKATEINSLFRVQIAHEFRATVFSLSLSLTHVWVRVWSLRFAVFYSHATMGAFATRQIKTVSVKHVKNQFKLFPKTSHKNLTACVLLCSFCTACSLTRLCWSVLGQFYMT